MATSLPTHHGHRISTITGSIYITPTIPSMPCQLIRRGGTIQVPDLAPATIIDALLGLEKTLNTELSRFYTSTTSIQRAVVIAMKDDFQWGRLNVRELAYALQKVNVYIPVEMPYETVSANTGTAAITSNTEDVDDKDEGSGYKKHTEILSPDDVRLSTDRNLIPHDAWVVEFGTEPPKSNADDVGYFNMVTIPFPDPDEARELRRQFWARFPNISEEYTPGGGFMD